jgi:glucokinase
MGIEQFAIGVDLGATKIASALVSPNGQILATRQALTSPKDGPEAVLDRLATEIDTLARISPGKLAGVGIGSPGSVDSITGIIRNAVNLGWCEVDIVSGVSARLRDELPIWVQKDANASALGELHFGSGQGCQDFIYITIGSGLGGGVIANGQLITGAHGNAAELGHLSLNPNGRPCACGLRGCAETIVSGPGLVSVVRELLDQEKYTSNLFNTTELTPAIILDAARMGDEASMMAFDKIGTALGQVLAACVAVLNPAQFIIGGGVGQAAFDLIAPAANLELARRTTKSSWMQLQIIPSRLASSAVGAACLVWQRK